MNTPTLTLLGTKLWILSLATLPLCFYIINHGFSDYHQAAPLINPEQFWEHMVWFPNHINAFAGHADYYEYRPHTPWIGLEKTWDVLMQDVTTIKNWDLGNDVGDAIRGKLLHLQELAGTAEIKLNAANQSIMEQNPHYFGTYYANTTPEERIDTIKEAVEACYEVSNYYLTHLKYKP